jgi:ketosteroid isomerase-like protein
VPVDADSFTGVAAALRELSDRQAIADLIFAYCEHFDANEPQAVAALFTDDAIIDYGPEVPTIIGGPAEIAARIAPGLEELFSATSHHVSNLRIELDWPDEARSVSYLYAWHRYLDGSPDGELWGRYRHAFRRSERGWRIASLRLEAAGTVDFHRAAMHPIGRRQAPS